MTFTLAFSYDPAPTVPCCSVAPCRNEGFLRLTTPQHPQHGRHFCPYHALGLDDVAPAVQPALALAGGAE